MCGIAEAITAVGIVGSLVGGASSYQTNQANAKASDYQAAIYKQNAEIANQNAVTERQSGIDESRRIKLKTLSNIASQKTAMAASGLDLNEGTALDLIDTTKYVGELDALTTIKNYDSRARAFESDAQNYLSQSGLSSMSAGNYRNSSWMSGLGTTLTGLGQVKGSWYNLGNSQPKITANNSVRMTP